MTTEQAQALADWLRGVENLNRECGIEFSYGAIILGPGDTISLDLRNREGRLVAEEMQS